MKLLRAILDLLFPPRHSERLVNEATRETLSTQVSIHRHIDGTVSLLPYRAPLVKACITEAKFRDSGRAQALLADVLAEHLLSFTRELQPRETSSVVLIPIPLSSKRMKERGYNQTERIARLATATLAGVTMDTQTLARTRNTLPQTSLGGLARRENVRGAFSAAVADSTYTYIVLDDVRTTGATLSEASAALRNAGAVHVYGLSLAH